jgi:prepilin-type processing-associated H-X9-DG protein
MKIRRTEGKMRKRAYSLIELLVVIGTIALLMSMLVPTLGQAHAQAKAVVCAGHLAQLGHAFHMYAAEYRGLALPLAYTDSSIIGDRPPVYWWGTNDGGGVDHTQGFVWPYLQSDLKRGGLFECPAQPWGSYHPQGAAEQVTSTYGYNGYYLCPPHSTRSRDIGRQPWKNLDCLSLPQRLFTFADTLIDMGDGLPSNNALLDPPFLYAGHRWVPNESPTTAFRHRGRVNVLLADGHGEGFGLAGERMQNEQYRIGSVGGENDPHYVPDWREW